MRKHRILLTVVLLGLATMVSIGQPVRADATSMTAEPPTPRQIFVCTSADLPHSLKTAVADFIANAQSVALISALQQGGDAGDAIATSSESLLSDKAFTKAANNHLVVIGLLSKDPLLQKVFGYNTTIDEQKKTAYAQGWGYLQGDVGWVESGRNPFMHSLRIRSSAHDTVLVNITGTTEAGLLAALHAFEHGLLNGFVVVGPIHRSETTILDRDPSINPIPVSLPATIEIEGKPAGLAGWDQIPEEEYRTWLEVGGSEPLRMWRCKYLPTRIMEADPAKRGLAGLHRMDFGNACTVAEFSSAADALRAARSIVARQRWSKANLDGFPNAWSAPQALDETVLVSYWTITVVAADRYVLMSTLPNAANTEIARRLTAQ